MRVLTDLVKSQGRIMEEQKEEHATQLDTFTKNFTQRIVTLKGQVIEMTEMMETQLSNIQPPPSASSRYAEVARSPSSNLQTLTSMGATPSTMTDTLYCTIDTSRVVEEDKDKAQAGTIRKAFEEEIGQRKDRGIGGALRCSRTPGTMIASE